MGDIRIPGHFPSPADVQGRRVVITGGTRGLGRLLVHAFSESGARVLAVARSEKDLKALRDELGPDVETCAADVSELAANQAVADRAVQNWGGVDVWIANAGISPVVASVLDMDPTTWTRVINVNLTGVFYGVQSVVPHMEPGGRIIVTSSILGERPRKGLHAYNASKAGVVGLVKGLALELAERDITVNAVAPGWFDSPMAQGWMSSESLTDEILGHTALGRWGRSEDLPGPFLFLASPASAFVTGTVLKVDGGYSCV